MSEPAKQPEEKQQQAQPKTFNNPQSLADHEWNREADKYGYDESMFWDY